MVRKSRQAGGNLPLTHYERTKKFASAEYGTVSQRLAGYSQYQLGDCALSLTRFSDEEVLCSPSGYLYAAEAIIEYLVNQTQSLNEQRLVYHKQEQKRTLEKVQSEEKSRLQLFEESQRMVKKLRKMDGKDDSNQKISAKEELKRSCYWIAQAQPERTDSEAMAVLPPERPSSPHSGEPLSRKDLWPVRLKWEGGKLICEVSGKAISAQATVVCWTDRKQPGFIVLTNLYDELIRDTKRCPQSGKKIKYVRALQQSGTSFAASTQKVEVSKYRPTIT